MTDSSNGERVLFVVSEPRLGSDVLDTVREHLHERPAEIKVVVPALIGSPVKHAMGDVDEAREEAQEVLERSLTQLQDAGTAASGQIGDSDPLLAIDDALATFGADEIVIITRPAEDARWLEDDLFERARTRFEQPLVHLEVDGSAGVVAEEDAGPGLESADAEIEGPSKNTPRFSVRDIAGIVIAVVGSIIAIALAATSSGDALQRDTGSGGTGSSGADVFAVIVAGAITLVNIAHVVGLVLFESVGYRGGFARVFSWLSLVGTPVAIALILIAV